MPSFESIYYSLIIGAFAMLFTYLFTESINGRPKKREAALDAAIRAGHRVTAVRYKRHATRRSWPGSHKHWSSIGYYRYEYKGRKYRYKYWADDPPTTLTLYFVKNPAKAAPAAALQAITINWFLFYPVAVVVSYILFFRG